MQSCSGRGASRALAWRVAARPLTRAWRVSRAQLEQQRHEESVERASIAHKWKNLKASVQPVGEAADSMGARLKGIAALAKAQRTAQVRSKWQHAVDSASSEGAGGGGGMGGSGTGPRGKAILRLVAAAKQQQQLEAESSAVLAAPARPGGGLALQSVDEEASVREVSGGVSGGMGGDARNGDTKAVAVPPPKPPGLQRSLTHSRCDASTAADRDGSWRVHDHKVARQLTRQLTQASSDGLVSATPPPTQSRQPATGQKNGPSLKEEKAPAKGSTACSIL